MLHHFVIIFILALALMLGRHAGATATLPASSGKPTQCARMRCHEHTVDGRRRCHRLHVRANRFLSRVASGSATVWR